MPEDSYFVQAGLKKIIQAHPYMLLLKKNPNLEENKRTAALITLAATWGQQNWLLKELGHI